MKPITSLRANGAAPEARAVDEAEGASGAAHEARATRGIEPGNVTLESLHDGANLTRLAQRLERERRWPKLIARNFVFGAAEHAKARPRGLACRNFAAAMRAGVAIITADDERRAGCAIASYDAAQPRHGVIGKVAAALQGADPRRHTNEHDRWLELRDELNAERLRAEFAATNESGEDGWGVAATHDASTNAPCANDELAATAVTPTRDCADNDSRSAQDTTQHDESDAIAFEHWPNVSRFFPAAGAELVSSFGMREFRVPLASVLPPGGQWRIEPVPAERSAFGMFTFRLMLENPGGTMLADPATWPRLLPPGRAPPESPNAPAGS